MVEVRVRVDVSYITTTWRWEELSRCDKFPTTPALSARTHLSSSIPSPMHVRNSPIIDQFASWEESLVKCGRQANSDAF